MVLDSGSAAKMTGPAAIDGIGPTDDWQAYWRKNRRNAAQGLELGESVIRTP